jgi:hypothetical protein
MKIAGILFLSLAGLIAGTNFFLSFLRYPLLRLLGHPRSEYRHVSGLPAIGTFFQVAGVACLWDVPWAWAAAAGLALLDTGGLPWFVVVMATQGRWFR